MPQSISHRHPRQVGIAPISNVLMRMHADTTDT